MKHQSGIDETGACRMRREPKKSIQAVKIYCSSKPEFMLGNPNDVPFCEPRERPRPIRGLELDPTTTSLWKLAHDERFGTFYLFIFYLLEAREITFFFFFNFFTHPHPKELTNMRNLSIVYLILSCVYI